MVSFKKLVTNNPELDNVQREIDKSFRSLDNPMFDGELIEKVVTPGVVANDFPVTHRLDRELRGYWIVSRTAPVDVYTSPTLNRLPAKQILLRATASNVTINLWVF